MTDEEFDVAQEESSILPSWERRDEIGVLRAFWRTLRELFSDRTRTFQAMEPEGDVGGPLLFMFICCVLGYLPSVLLYGIYVIIFLFAAQPLPGSGVNPYAMQQFSVVGIMIAMPVLQVFPILLASAAAHMTVRTTGGVPYSYVVSARLVLYAKGAGNVLYLVPCLALILVPVWTLVAWVVGFRAVYRTNWLIAALGGAVATAVHVAGLSCELYLIEQIGGSLGSSLSFAPIMVF